MPVRKDSKGILWTVGRVCLFLTAILPFLPSYGNDLETLRETRLELQKIMRDLASLQAGLDSDINHTDEIIGLLKDEPLSENDPQSNDVGESKIDSGIEEVQAESRYELPTVDLFQNQQPDPDAGVSNDMVKVIEENSAPSEIDLYLQELKRELKEIRGNYESLSNSFEDPLPRKHESVGKEPRVDQPSKDKGPVVSSQETSGNSSQVNDSSKRRPLDGFYLLPFAGMVVPGDLTMSGFSAFGQFDVEDENGFALGMKGGLFGKHWFAEAEWFWNRTTQSDRLEIKMPSSPSIFLPYEGEIRGLGAFLSGGWKANLSDRLALLLGLGMGGLDQEVSYTIQGISLTQDDLLFTYQALAGLVFSPVDHLLVGMRYRWVSVAEMESFSSRNLHLLEFNAGYDF